MEKINTIIQAEQFLKDCGFELFISGNGCYEIIAEIGQNHNGDLGLAAEMIRQAKRAGAHVAKFQLFDAKKTFPPKEKNEWFDYNCKTELTREQLKQIATICEHEQIEFMASAFDVQRVGWLEELGVKKHKIASRSIEDKPLIDALIKTGKPLVVSLGWWKSDKLPEIATRGKVDFLYCVSKYPTELEDLEFSKIDFVKTYAGFSDHTLGVHAPMAAMARGARIIEKHFTLDKKMYGPDHSCSMTQDELVQIVEFSRSLSRMIRD